MGEIDLGDLAAITCEVPDSSEPGYWDATERGIPVSDIIYEAPQVPSRVAVDSQMEDWMQE